MAETEKPWTAEGLNIEERIDSVYRVTNKIFSGAIKPLVEAMEAAVKEALADQKVAFFKELAGRGDGRKRTFFSGGKVYKVEAWCYGYLEDDDTSVGWEDVLDATEDAVRDALADAAPKWIRVGERLPSASYIESVSVDCWVLDDDGDIYLAYYDFQYKVWADSNGTGNTYEPKFYQVANKPAPPKE